MDPDGGNFYLMLSISPSIAVLSYGYFQNWVMVCLSSGTYGNLLMFTLESISNQSIHFGLARRQSCSFMFRIKGAKLSPWCAALLLSLSSIWAAFTATVNCNLGNCSLELSKGNFCLDVLIFGYSSGCDHNYHWLFWPFTKYTLC